MIKSNLYLGLDPVYYASKSNTGGPKNNGPNKTFVKIIVITLLLLSFIISFNLHFLN